MDYVRAIIKEEVPLAKIDGLAWNDDWDIRDFTPRKPGKLFQQIWTKGKRTQIQYTEDPLLDLRYIMVSGPDQQKVLRKIQETFPVYNESEVRRMLKIAQTPQERARAILHIGISAPADFDATFLGYFNSAFADEDANVRWAAAAVSGYTNWPELRDVLQQLAKADSDLKVRKAAKHSLMQLPLPPEDGQNSPLTTHEPKTES